MQTSNEINEETRLTIMPTETTATELSIYQIFKNLSKIGLPMAASYTFSLEMALLVVFLGRINSDEAHTASITLITNMLNTLVGIGISPLYAMSIVASIKTGKLKTLEASDEEGAQIIRDEIARINHHGMVMAAGMTPIMALPMIFSKQILTFIGQDNAVATAASSFLMPYAINTLALAQRLCAEQNIFAFGRSLHAMVMGLSSASIGMGLAALLGFGKLGAPNMGQNGILIGYTAESYLTALAFSLYIVLHPDFKKYSFFRPKEFLKHFKEIKELLVLARSIMPGIATEMFCLLATSAIAGLCGVTAQAAYSTTMQFTLLTFLLEIAFSQTTCQDTARLIGGKDYINASKVGLTGLLTTVTYVAPLPILFAIAPNFLSVILGQPQNNYTNTLAPLMAVNTIIDATRFNLLQQLRNILKDGGKSTLISAVCQMAGVFLSWFLGTKTNLGIYGVALGFMIGALSAALILSVRFKSRNKPEVIQALYEEEIPAPKNNIGFFRASSRDSEIREIPIPKEENGYNDRLLAH